MLLAGPTFARAEPSATDIAIAKRLFADATADEAAERWADGLAKLRRVVAIKETAGVRFHIAVCEQHLGALLASRDSFERSSRLAEKLSGNEARQIVDAAADAIVRIDERIPTLVLNVAGGAKDMTVKLDGTVLDAATLGRPLKHDPGEARVEASAPGKRRFDKSLVLVDRATVTLEIALDAEAVPEVGGAPATTASSPSVQPAMRRERSVVPTAAWILGGASLGSAGAALYLLLHRSSLVSETEVTCANPYVRCDREARDGRAATYLVGGLVAAGASVVLGGLTAYVVIRGDGTASPTTGLAAGSEVVVRGAF